jgi:hypothetical protein
MKLLLIKHQSPEYKTTWDITHLPLLQWYEVKSQSHLPELHIGEIYYTIKTTYRSIGWIPESFFLTEEQWRDKQLNNILL